MNKQQLIDKYGLELYEELSYYKPGEQHHLSNVTSINNVYGLPLRGGIKDKHFLLVFLNMPHSCTVAELEYKEDGTGFFREKFTGGHNNKNVSATIEEIIEEYGQGND